MQSCQPSPCCILGWAGQAPRSPPAQRAFVPLPWGSCVPVPAKARLEAVTPPRLLPPTHMESCTMFCSCLKAFEHHQTAFNHGLSAWWTPLLKGLEVVAPGGICPPSANGSAIAQGLASLLVSSVLCQPLHWCWTKIRERGLCYCHMQVLPVTAVSHPGTPHTSFSPTARMDGDPSTSLHAWPPGNALAASLHVPAEIHFHWHPLISTSGTRG